MKIPPMGNHCRKMNSQATRHTIIVTPANARSFGISGLIPARSGPTLPCALPVASLVGVLTCKPGGSIGFDSKLDYHSRRAVDPPEGSILGKNPGTHRGRAELVWSAMIFLWILAIPTVSQGSPAKFVYFDF